MATLGKAIIFGSPKEEEAILNCQVEDDGPSESDLRHIGLMESRAG